MDLITTATSSDESERAASVAVLPVGSFEQHGAHLPLVTDTVVACAIAKAVAERYDLFLLPPVTISCSHEHAAWRGVERSVSAPPPSPPWSLISLALCAHLVLIDSR